MSLKPYAVEVSVQLVLAVFADSPEGARAAAQTSLETPYLEVGHYHLARQGPFQVHPILLPEVQPTDPHLPVEYDEDYAGGNYSSMGDTAYIPVAYIVPLGSVLAAFAFVTGLGPDCIVSYNSEDDEEYYCTADGTPLRELENEEEKKGNGTDAYDH